MSSFCVKHFDVHVGNCNVCWIRSFRTKTERPSVFEYPNPLDIRVHVHFNISSTKCQYKSLLICVPVLGCAGVFYLDFESVRVYRPGWVIFMSAVSPAPMELAGNRGHSFSNVVGTSKVVLVFSAA